jgi:hypothetical protein
MSIRNEVLALLLEMVNPRPRYPKLLDAAPTSANSKATVEMETPEPLEPKAIYLDGKSFDDLMRDCQISDLHPEGTFQGVPLFSVRRYGVQTGKHIHIHGEPY